MVGDGPVLPGSGRGLVSLVTHKIHRAIRRLAGYVLAVLLGATGTLSSRSVVDPAASCVVSLTTYGDRLQTAHLTIESIGRGAVLPRRLILWVDEGDRARLTPQLRALVRRGLDIQETRGEWGPHKKYYPYCVQHAEDGLLLVTADDDVFYQRSWLRGLISHAAQVPGVVWSYRARRIEFDGDALSPYRRWPLVSTSRPSSVHLATGVGGVIYPPGLQVVLRDAGEDFMAEHGRTDDIWLHLQEIRSGYAVSQISAWPVSNIEIPRSQRAGLLITNQSGGQNDSALARTYTDDELTALRAHAVDPRN